MTRGTVGYMNPGHVQVPSADRRGEWTVSSGNCRVQREAVGMGAQMPAEGRGGEQACECMYMQRAECGIGEVREGACRGQDTQGPCVCRYLPVRGQECSGHVSVDTCRGQWRAVSMRVPAEAK